jgi:single-stranded DNA-binding protein
LAYPRKRAGQDNQEHYTTEIIAEKMQMLGGHERGPEASGAYR